MNLSENYQKVKELIICELKQSQYIKGDVIRSRLKTWYQVDIDPTQLRQLIKELRKTEFIIASPHGYRYFSKGELESSPKAKEQLIEYLESRSKDIASEQIIINIMKHNFNQFEMETQKPSLFDGVNSNATSN